MASPLTTERLVAPSYARSGRDRRCPGGHGARALAQGQPGRLRHRPVRIPGSRSDGRPADAAAVLSGRTGGRLGGWSPDGAWSGLPGEPRAARLRRLHVVRPDGTGRRRIAGEDPRATVFAGGGTGPGSYVCSIAPGDGRTPTSCWSPSRRREAAARPRRLPLGTRCPPTGGSCWPVGAARIPAHRVIDFATACSSRWLSLDAPGCIASEDGRFGPTASVHVPRLAARRPGTDRAVSWWSRCPRDGVPGRGARASCTAPTDDLDGYAVRADATCSRCGRSRGQRAVGARPSEVSRLRRIELPEPVMPAVARRRRRDAASPELTGPLAPRGSGGSAERGVPSARALPSGPQRPPLPNS